MCHSKSNYLFAFLHQTTDLRNGPGQNEFYNKGQEGLTGPNMHRFNGTVNSWAFSSTNVPNQLFSMFPSKLWFFFSYHLMPRLGFEHMPVEMNQPGTFVRTHYRLSYPATAATAPTAAGFELNIHKTFACMQHKYKDTMWTKLPFQVCFVPPHSRYNYRPWKIVILLIVKSKERLLLLFSWSGCSRESWVAGAA